MGQCPASWGCRIHRTQNVLPTFCACASHHSHIRAAHIGCPGNCTLQATPSSPSLSVCLSVCMYLCFSVRPLTPLVWNSKPASQFSSQKENKSAELQNNNNNDNDNRKLSNLCCPHPTTKTLLQIKQAAKRRSWFQSPSPLDLEYPNQKKAKKIHNNKQTRAPKCQKLILAYSKQSVRVSFLFQFSRVAPKVAISHKRI